MSFQWSFKRLILEILEYLFLFGGSFILFLIYWTSFYYDTAKNLQWIVILSTWILRWWIITIFTCWLSIFQNGGGCAVLKLLTICHLLQEFLLELVVTQLIIRNLGRFPVGSIVLHIQLFQINRSLYILQFINQRLFLLLSLIEMLIIWRLLLIKFLFFFNLSYLILFSFLLLFF